MGRNAETDCATKAPIVLRYKVLRERIQSEWLIKGSNNSRMLITSSDSPVSSCCMIGKKKKKKKFCQSSESNRVLIRMWAAHSVSSREGRLLLLCFKQSWIPSPQRERTWLNRRLRMSQSDSLITNKGFKVSWRPESSSTSSFYFCFLPPDPMIRI